MTFRFALRKCDSNLTKFPFKLFIGQKWRCHHEQRGPIQGGHGENEAIRQKVTKSVRSRKPPEGLRRLRGALFWSESKLTNMFILEKLMLVIYEKIL
ncbi:hypothetical protein F2P81_014422 [Scophthalmus maximus]|uniref:Uncharacterized protein n=1 Tax=Scophthalmus maximus TaxID=52904 RepID=A0A6A4SGS8_SCOMX|nr:hypothetical protein F2P81_014422 [Scophthalmus maximus]